MESSVMVLYLLSLLEMVFSLVSVFNWLWVFFQMYFFCPTQLPVVYTVAICKIKKNKYTNIVKVEHDSGLTCT